MQNRRLWAFWALLLVGATLAGLPALVAGHWGLLPVLFVAWLLTLIGRQESALARRIAALLRLLRVRPALLWLLLLVYVAVTLIVWFGAAEPSYGRWLQPVEYSYLLLALWGAVFLLAFGLTADQRREMGMRLGKSRFAGLLVTLTTLALLLLGAEAGLRLFYVTTDGFGFTAMNYYWYQNFYWGHENSLGYRDYEPQPDAQTHIAVVGDSFAAGHGINDINQTFPQLLEQRLGPGYDVNLVAKSGWDTDVQLANLMEYTPRPNVVVLSYYLNDIDWLLRDTALNPDAAFDFPQDPALSWVVQNYFLPSFIYYNLAQFTSPTRTTTHTNNLFSAHLDDNIWAQQAQMLDNFAWWCRTNDMQLIVLLWPHLTEIEQSAPSMARVRDLFAAQGVPVIDMSAVLAGRNPSAIIVNTYDAHPGFEAQQLAADQLAGVILALPAVIAAPGG